MKVLICTLNSKYIHSSLSVWCLMAGARAFAPDCKCDVFEGTVNESFDELLSKILEYDFDMIAFSTYIWNKNMTLDLAREIKKHRDVKVSLGGPEVSYNVREVMEKYYFVDYVLSGEGEEIFGRLCSGESAENIPEYSG